MRFSTAAVLIVAMFQHCLAWATEQTCGDIIGERPNSSAARVCATKELAAEEAKLRSVEKKIIGVLTTNSGLLLLCQIASPNDAGGVMPCLS